MTTGPIGSTFASGDPLLYVLAQRVEVERENQHYDDSVRARAREARLAADRAAVDALHDKADAIRTGAWVSLAVTAASTGAQAAGVATRSSASAENAGDAAQSTATCKLSAGFTAGGAGLSAGSEPAGRLFGDAPAAGYEADAKAAQGRADEARGRYETAESAKHKSEKHLDAMFEQVQRIVNLARQGLDHVLGKF
jgi:hypothetical protein